MALDRLCLAYPKNASLWVVNSGRYTYCLEIMLILDASMCRVCTERTIGSEIILDAPDGSPR
jgi:hypothetical protein